MDDRSDNELMLLLRGGSREAVGTLFARHHRSVYALCYRMTGDTAAADDLAQESFLRLLRYNENFDGRSLFTTWLYRVVRNLCLDHLSRRKRERRMQERLSLETEHGTIEFKRDKKIEDVTTIASTYLIRHIDNAFIVWERTPEKARVSFDAFLNFVLPYRGSQEPVEDWLSPLMHRYAHAWLQRDDDMDPNKVL